MGCYKQTIMHGPVTTIDDKKHSMAAQMKIEYKTTPLTSLFHVKDIVY